MRVLSDTSTDISQHKPDDTPNFRNTIISHRQSLYSACSYSQSIDSNCTQCVSHIQFCTDTIRFRWICQHTKHTMSSNSREVCLEVYVNGELYSTDSCWVPDEKDVQVEFMVTDRIYELLGCSPGDITAQMEVDTDECMSVRHCALEGEDLHIDIDMKHPTCTPENSPTESTTEWMMRRIGGFFQSLFWVHPAVPEQTSDTDRVPEPEPEANLVSVCWPAEVSGSGSGIEMNGSKESTKEKINAFFKKDFPLDPSEPPCVPDASSSEPEPVSAEGPEDDVSDGMDDQDVMDASPEPPQMNVPKESTKEKINAFFKKDFPLDPSEPPCVPDASSSEAEPVSAEGPEDDVSDGMDDQDGMDASPESPQMNVPKESTKEKINAFFKKYFPLDPPEPPCVPDASSSEPEPVSAEGPEDDVNDGMDASPESPQMNVPKESTKEKINAFFKKYFPIDPSEPPCPEPELELVDTMESCVPVPSVPDSDSDDSCVPGPSSYVPKSDKSTSKQEPFPEEHCFRLEKRVKGCTQRHRPVTTVWNNIFIGNEEIARDRIKLKELGITHILNVAAVLPWETDLREAVNTGVFYYRGMNIKYCGMAASHGSDISKYFYKAAKLIRKAKKNPENKVLIHCTEGISYAPTLFLAYLMIHHNMTVEDAIDHLIKIKYIKPDIEFLKQLAVLNQDLVHKSKTTATGHTSRKTKLSRAPRKNSAQKQIKDAVMRGRA